MKVEMLTGSIVFSSNADNPTSGRKDFHFHCEVFWK